MKEESIRGLTIASLVFLTGLFNQIVPITAQDCGELSREQCGYLSATVENWNRYIGGSYSIVRSIHVGRIDPDIAISSINETDRIWIPVYEDVERTVSLVSLDNRDLIRQWRSEQASYMEQKLRGAKDINLVTLDWQNSNGPDFQTDLVLSDVYPFVHGQIVSGVVIESDNNGSFRKELSWLWGLIRGEIYVNVIHSSSGYGDASWCRQYAHAWLDLGDAQVNMKDPEYNNGVCRSAYTWGYVTPIASLTFEIEAFSFTISGIGASGKGLGVCEAPRKGRSICDDSR